MAAATIAPEATEGAYLTDGKRLVEVIGVDGDGDFHLEDCAGDVGEKGGTIKVTSEELLRDWEVISRG